MSYTPTMDYEELTNRRCLIHSRWTLKNRQIGDWEKMKATIEERK